MIKILLILFFYLSLSIPSQAENIKDFQIGKMNVKDSLLDYFDKKAIIKDLNSNYTHFYKNKAYAIITAGSSDNYDLRINTHPYDDIAITIKPADKKFIIYALSGRIFCPDDINYCTSKKKEIENELKIFFGKNVEFKVDDGTHSYDKTGKSKTYNTYFIFESGDYVSVSTYDWHKDAKNKNGRSFPDNTKVSIMTNEFEQFLSNVQFN